MQTDANLIARLAHEIHERFAGARVQDAGRLEDGRFALALWKKGSTVLLCADVFAPTPVLTIENGELPVSVEPGFVRAAVTSLRGKSLASARSREGERILELDFGSQSRFGVPESYTLIFELVPRFGNIVLVKDRTVVAALKEFRASGKAKRSIRAGAEYEPPPERPRKTRQPDEPDERTLRSGDLYVYRDGNGALLQVSLLPLNEYAGAPVERASSFLDLLSEAAVRTGQPSSAGAGNSREAALRALQGREQKLRADLERIASQLAQTSARDELRVQGENIYATLHRLPPAQQAAAKSEAAGLFSRYKKAGSAATHLERRRKTIESALLQIDELRWELERADEERVREVADLVLKPRTAPSPKARKRAPMQGTTPNGSRIFVGRSPLENAELTFHVAKPSDLWFHARGQPGAHVILQRDDRAEPPQQDIQIAAELAALHSKGKRSSKVTVDYALRKHVRKRPNAAPGLVFYTNASSIAVEPRDSMNIASPNEKKR